MNNSLTLAIQGRVRLGANTPIPPDPVGTPDFDTVDFDDLDFNTGVTP